MKVLFGLLVLVGLIFATTTSYAKQDVAIEKKVGFSDSYDAPVFDLGTALNVSTAAICASEVFIPNLNGKFIYWYTPIATGRKSFFKDGWFPLPRSRLIRCGGQGLAI